MKKYSKKFELDYKFYLLNSSRFTFCGLAIAQQKGREIFAEYDEKGVSAKEAFYEFDTKGKRVATCEPDEYRRVMTCKASLNFHIKLWFRFTQHIWSEGFIDIAQSIDDYFCNLILPFNYNIIPFKKVLINQICKCYPSINKDSLLLTQNNEQKKRFLQCKKVRVKL